MNSSLARRIALACLIAPIAISCSTTERLNRAATTKGQTQAGIVLPPLPEDLRKKEAHAPVTEGQPVISILARERQALDRANARQGRAVQFYDDIRTKYGTRP